MRLFCLDYDDLSEKEFQLLFKWSYRFTELKIESIEMREKDNNEVLYVIGFYPNRSAYDLMNLIKGKTVIEP